MAAHGSMAISRPANSPTEVGAVAGLLMMFRGREPVCRRRGNGLF